jgi:cobalt-zinc-cadmium resistance protein CzcA
VSTVVAKLGRPEDGSDAKGANQIEALVALKPEKEWPKGVDKRQLVSDLQRTLEQRIPGPSSRSRSRCATTSWRASRRSRARW